MLLDTHRSSRRAAHIPELALVLSIVLMLLFGIFDYCRFIFLLQVAENAARDGCRFAIARTADGTTLADVQNYVTARMAGRERDLTGYSVEVLNVFPDTGLAVPGTNWNDAPFGGAILVRVSGTFKPLFPVLLKQAESIPVRATAMMTSEAN